jgi:lipopolysaccharide transport system ATP-binding protein
VTQSLLKVDGVGKRYVEYSSELKRFATWFGARFEPQREYWAVRDISFSLKAGEALAIIGQNGAGKSTTLKLITGTVRPSTGRVDVRGRISAILELGLGFNPDLTGRQNIYQAGGLMGYSSNELSRLMPDIEAFAEIAAFFDQPLRTYSSGMQARLAFALATATRPDILIVDEVLSVGDSYFQHKSFNRIREFKAQGTAILLVSHALSDVRQLCERVVLLEQGRVLRDGPPDEVVDYYNALIAQKENSKLTIEQRRNTLGWTESRSGTFDAVVNSVRLLDAETAGDVELARVGQELELRIDVEARSNIETLVLGLMIRDRTGHVIFGTNTWHTKQVVEQVKAHEKLRFRIRLHSTLGPGSYSITSALTGGPTHLEKNYEWSDNALVFDVMNTEHPFFIGCSLLDTRIEIERGALLG